MNHPLAKLTLAALLSLALQLLAHGQVLVSVNFQGSDTVGLASTDTTGASGFAGANWNNEAGASGTSLALNSSTGAASALTLNSYNAGPFGAEGPNTDNSTPQKTLFGGDLDVNFGSAGFTVSGLTGTYDLLVYYSAGTSFPNVRDAQISASGSNLTYYITGISTVYTAFTQSNSTDSTNYATGNYVEFTGLTAGTETVTMGNSNNNMGLVGFQIFEPSDSSSPVPEPSTWALLAGGAGLLFGLRRWRRA